jgi:hypothetical protein
MRLRSSELSARALGGETIVLDLATSRYLSITGVGSRIFELLSEERSVDELVATIVAEYEVEAPDARRDIERFLVDLRTADLLQ